MPSNLRSYLEASPIFAHELLSMASVVYDEEVVLSVMFMDVVEYCQVQADLRVSVHFDLGSRAVESKS